jgi:hypothetical protein
MGSMEELKVALQCASPPSAMTGEKIRALNYLSLEMPNVERVSGKLLRPSRGMVSDFKHVFKDKERKEQLAKLKATIDICVGKLTLPEVTESHTLNPRPQTPDPNLSSLKSGRFIGD